MENTETHQRSHFRWGLATGATLWLTGVVYENYFDNNVENLDYAIGGFAVGGTIVLATLASEYWSSRDTRT